MPRLTVASPGTAISSLRCLSIREHIIGVSVNETNADTKIVTLNVTAKTYRYLDEEDKAATGQKKAGQP